MATTLRYIINNDGTYYIHCLEGKDRTGYTCIILELLCGASYEEVKEDYAITFYNYYGITKEDKRYNLVINEMEVMIKLMFEITEVNETTVKTGLNYYLTQKVKLTQTEIDALIEQLTSA